MFRKIFALTLTLAISLMACNPQQVTREAGSLTRIRLPMGYIPNIQYAPFYVAVEKGYFRAAGIEIEFDYSFETDGVALVGAGELPFAVASGEQVLLARAQGLPVVYVVAWYQDYPVSVIAKAEQNINSPADLRGKKIGLPGLLGATYIGLQALLFSAGLTADDVTLDSIGFNQVEALATDQEQAVVGYTSNEPIQLRAQGYEVTELRVADYVELAANGIIASEKVIAENPELVRAFVGAFLKGLADTIEIPNDAFTLSESHIPNFADLDPEVQRGVLKISIGQWLTERLGYSDPRAWANMNDLLVRMGLLTAPLDVDAAFTNEFVP